MNGASPSEYAESLGRERYYTDTVERYSKALEKHVEAIRKERATWTSTK